MSHRVTVRSAEIFAGLISPHVSPGAESSGSELVRFLQERIQERAGMPVDVATIYVPDPKGSYNVLVGLSYASPAEVPDGDVFVSVPSGVYALFTPDPIHSDPVEDVWLQVDEAADNGEIFRAYKEEIELRGLDGTVELYISVVI